MKKLIIANWKANPVSAGEAVRLARGIEHGLKKVKAEVVVAPPFEFFLPVGRVLRRAKLGAQDIFWEGSGPYTGEVSWQELKKLGVAYVIVGHSERRRLLGETDEMINKKVSAAIKAGIVPVLCVGEPARIRKRGINTAKNFVKIQLQKDLVRLPEVSAKGGSAAGGKGQMSKVVVAYEPIWAISTQKGAKADTPENAAEMIRYIRSVLNSKFLIRNSTVIYGGSVNAKNAARFLGHPEIEGALVGGASLKPKEFLKIVAAAS